jgi:Flp pilus assembly protein TadG
MMTGPVARRRKGRGQSLAEFTLAIPLFLLVLLGIAEGGYFVVATTIVSHATNEGVRYGVLDSTPSRGAVRTRVQEAAAPVVALTETAINLGLTRANGTVEPNCNDACFTAREPGDRLTVKTTYTHRPLVGYVFGALEFPANAEAELLVEGS